MRAASLPVALAALLLAAVVLLSRPADTHWVPPRLGSSYFVTTANVKLPVHAWLPDRRRQKAVIVALHGFNDYGKFFSEAGEYFKDLGIASYSYDQRGFGAGPDPGSWATIRTYVEDLIEFARLVRERHPDVPMYLLGESMGAAEIIIAMTSGRKPKAEGVILSAPAVWDPSTIPWYQRAGLWLAARVAPSFQLTGESLHVVPSDNIEMLRALNRDPLVIKETRIGTVHGLYHLMTRAFIEAGRLDTRALLLYGERDEIIPRLSVYRMLNALPPSRRWRAAFYEDGYHLLLRDLEAPKLWRDIASWIDNPLQRLPSGADKRAVAALAGSR